jgi:two-component system LytT family response regulator
LAPVAGRSARAPARERLSVQAIRIAIAAPDPFLRRRLRDLVRAERDFDLVAECGDGVELSAELRRLHPDALLLDLALPRADPLEMTRRFDPGRGPVVVFLSAEAEQAQDAFDVGALDCVRKPVEDQRLARTLQRVRTRVRAEGAAKVSERLSDLLRQLRSAADYPSRIPVSSEGRLLFVPVHDIDWIEGSGNYACLRVGGRVYRLRNTLSAIERILDPGAFRRIHRGVIVNLSRIHAVEPQSGASAVVHLHDGTTLRLSRGYRYVLSWLGSDASGAASRDEAAVNDREGSLVNDAAPAAGGSRRPRV